MPQAEKLLIRGLWSDGNAFAILGKFQRAAQRAGWSKERIREVLDKAKSADYDNLLVTIMEVADETDEDEEVDIDDE